MDTSEHTELGDALRFADWEDSLQGNPYISFSSEGTMRIQLQGLDQNQVPIPLNLTLSAGEVIGMSGDYFGGKEVDLKLPSQTEFNDMKCQGESDDLCEHLGEYLIKKRITDAEVVKFTNSYKRLADPKLKRSDIDLIYKINSTNYIPFSPALNSYVQQLAFAIRVKNYGEMLNRNMSHFVPWSVRAYVIGHNLALKYAKVYYELAQFMQAKQKGEHYQSTNSDFRAIREQVENLSENNLKNWAHRYQALALSMEFFSFHYYTDHYAAGHGSFVGDLRVLLPRRYGYLGGILVNNIHDELNSITVYTRRPYDPTPDSTEPPIEASGDGDFDSPKNSFNKKACIAGMSDSLRDIHQVFNGADAPSQSQYGGLEKMPDIDDKYRQPQPLFLLGKDNRIFYRTNLSTINLLAPSQLKAAYQEPLNHGYTELKSTWGALVLAFKLRVLTYWYGGTLQEPSKEQLRAIELEEAGLNPGRKPIPHLAPMIPVLVADEPIAQWKKPASAAIVAKGLNSNSLLKAPVHKDNESVEHEQALSLS